MKIFKFGRPKSSATLGDCAAMKQGTLAHAVVQLLRGCRDKFRYGCASLPMEEMGREG